MLAIMRNIYKKVGWKGVLAIEQEGFFQTATAKYYK